MSFAELIIDTKEPEGDDDAMFIKSSRFNTTKYLAQNTFDQATVKHSTVEQITSNGLSGIFASLKPLGKIHIIVHQPIAVMIFYDSKQIEANLKLAGFENIKISDIKYKDELIKQEIQTQEIVAEKPESKRNYDVAIEIKKTTIKEQKPFDNNKFISTKVTKKMKMNIKMIIKKLLKLKKKNLKKMNSKKKKKILITEILKLKKRNLKRNLIIKNQMKKKIINIF